MDKKGTSLCHCKLEKTHCKLGRDYLPMSASFNNQPIGVFDSGVGGLSVLLELSKQLPDEHFHYYADTKHCPYGPRPAAEIIELSCKVVDFLLEQKCKMIVVACNTATASAIDYLRTHYDIPFIGLEPAVKPAAQLTATGNVGILATEGTFKGRLYKETSQLYADHVTLHLQVGHGLVEAVEQGAVDAPATRKLLRNYLAPMLEAKVDQVVLGCTHYPFLIPVIEELVDGKASIINPAPAVARQAGRILKQHDIEAQESCVQEVFLTASGTSDRMTSLWAEIAAY